jgi:DMSO/TMAO reductase YedYZ molybdopterin-dependent catalytic subunit
MSSEFQAGSQHSPTLSSSQAAGAGAIAATIMLAVQLIWRNNWSTNGVVQAFPEFIVAAVSRLTPLSVFGAATENYGSMAKKTLFLSVLIGVIAVGALGGRAARRLSIQFDRGFWGRLLGGIIVAAVLLLITGVIILPIAYLGLFASKSSYTNEILTQLFVTFGIYGLAWALLATPAAVEKPAMSSTDPTTDRRTIVTRGGTAIVGLGAIVALGGSSWRLLSPKQRTTAAPAPASASDAGGTVTATSESLTTQDIVATQRANQGYDTYEEPPTQPAESSFESEEPLKVAELQSDTTPEADPFAIYNQLESEHKLTSVLTETEDFYHVSKNLSDPTVDADGWTLSIKGLVNQPLTLTLDDLNQRATTHKITTLMCISNEINGDLTGTAEWIGVPLADLLNEAGVQAGVFDVKLHAADDYEDSFPIEKGLDPDTLVVVGMNGAPLRDDHGYPARIIVPGIYGMKNVKWVDSIELIDHDFKGYWQTRGWSDSAVPQIWGRIDYPITGKIDPGQQYVDGLATAGDRGISKVEVSLDDGNTWADAQLEPSINPPFTWVRWVYPFTATSGQELVIKMRATDGEGTQMIEDGRSPLPDGATGYPRRRVKVK